MKQSILLVKERIDALQKINFIEAIDNLRLSLEDKHLQLKDANKLVARIDLLVMNIELGNFDE